MTAMKDWIQHEIDTLRRNALIMELHETNVRLLYALIEGKDKSPEHSPAINDVLEKSQKERHLMSKEITSAERMRLVPKP